MELMLMAFAKLSYHKWEFGMLFNTKVGRDERNWLDPICK